MKKRLIKIAICSIIAVFCMSSAVATGNIGSTELLSVDSVGLSNSVGFKKSTKYTFTKLKKSIAAYKKVNNDVVGWLVVPGTNINEPVTFSNKSNNYYVKRDWSGQDYPSLGYSNWNKYPATATYLDYRAKLGETWQKTSKNIVLYGHNWNNLNESSLVIGNHEGYTMFAQLPSYVNAEFALKNPYIYFSSEHEEGIWKIFAVAYAETKSNFPYNSPNPTKDYYGEMLKDWKHRSIHDFDTDVNANDKIITLSTCTRQYSVGEDQRFVVVARLLREGESETDKVKIADDGKFKKPQF